MGGTGRKMAQMLAEGIAAKVDRVAEGESMSHACFSTRLDPIGNRGDDGDDLCLRGKHSTSEA